MIPWCSAPWLTTLREFLNQINGQIILDNPWTPQSRWQGNKFIMEEMLKLPLKPRQYEILNNIHILLKATKLADIVKQNGTHIRKECLRKPTSLPQKEEFYDPNVNTLNWPQHAEPSDAGWRLWKQMVKKMFPCDNKQKALQTPMGQWQEAYGMDYQWRWRICPTTFNLFHKTQKGWRIYRPLSLQ